MKKDKKRILIIIGLIALLILFIVLLVVLYRMKMRKIDNTMIVSAELDERDYSKFKEVEYETQLKEISEMSEQKRMRHYSTEFIKAIESKNYKKAYGYLNNDFKNAYFKTEEDFTNYAKKYFPKEMSTKYTNMERLGNIYVLVVEVEDILSYDPNNFEMYVVVKEDEYDKFELSFSADKPMAKYNETIEANN